MDVLWSFLFPLRAAAGSLIFKKERLAAYVSCLRVLAPPRERGCLVLAQGRVFHGRAMTL
jgi:hypothetical protein